MWQVLFNQYTGGVIIGYIILQTAGVIASLILRKITFLTSVHRSIIMAVNIIVMLCLAIWHHNLLLLTCLMCLHVFCHTMQGIFIFSRFQENISENTRATSLSIVSATESVLVIISYYWVGRLMDSGNMLLPFCISMANGIVAILLFIFRDNDKR